MCALSICVTVVDNEKNIEIEYQAIVYIYINLVLFRLKYVFLYSIYRNRQTIKGVNFFGPRSEFIMSGSDCGNIFMWDKNTESIVQWLPGDDAGVVNCLEGMCSTSFRSHVGFGCGKQ